VKPPTPCCIRNLPQSASAVLIPIVRHGDGALERRYGRLAESLARRRSRWRTNAIPRYAPFPRKRADACRRRRDACPGVIAGVSRADGPSAPAPQTQRLGRRLQIERRSRVDDPHRIVADSCDANSGRGEQRARLRRFQREAPSRICDGTAMSRRPWCSSVAAGGSLTIVR
jgi:hypothetical protein